MNATLLERGLMHLCLRFIYPFSKCLTRVSGVLQQTCLR